MDKLKNIWKALDNKKTFYSAVIATVYFIGLEHGVWASNDVFEFVFQLAFGIGVADKARKRYTK